MTPLPDRLRPRLSPPARALATSLLHLTAFAAWRTMHPAVRQRFLEAPRPPALRRLHYEASDGWRAPLFHLPAAPGGAGEPVVIAHALGLAGDAYRYGRGPTLASRIARAGFDVYLLAHRGDRDAVPPHPRAGFDFDDLVHRDLPAALERACSDAGYPRALWVGHGLGGQVGLAGAARRQGPLAGVVALGAPVRFQRPATETRRLAVARALLPQGWRIPARWAAGVAVPWIDDPEAGARLRGVLRYATEDLSTGLLRQMLRWVRSGSLVDRTGLLDYREAFRDARVPLLSLAGSVDRVAPPARAHAAADTWGDDDATALTAEGLDHLGVLLAPAADGAVFDPVADWLDARRRCCW